MRSKDSLPDCSIEGCVRKAPQRGWCPAHYQRWRKYGDPLGVAPKREKRPVREASELDEATRSRFWSRVDRTGTCWLWTGAIGHPGYGLVRIDDKARSTHRLAYELTNGAIPDGLFIDHRCGQRACCNPEHMRLATPKENMENLTVLRGDNKSGARGVSWSTQAQKWVVQVQHNGQRVFHKQYKDFDEARDVAIEVRNRYFTHNDADRMAA